MGTQERNVKSDRIRVANVAEDIMQRSFSTWLKSSRQWKISNVSQAKAPCHFFLIQLLNVESPCPEVSSSCSFFYKPMNPQYMSSPTSLLTYKISSFSPIFHRTSISFSMLQPLHISFLPHLPQRMVPLFLLLPSRKPNIDSSPHMS